jgi:endoglucanase
MNLTVYKKQFRLIKWQRLLLISLVSVVLIVGLSWQLPMLTSAQAVNPQMPLSTRGAAIVDATGRSILLRGVNWFGMETDLQVPHGLWKRDYKEMLAQIRSLGYNTIRLPYSVQALRSNQISGVDFSIGSNQQLQGKTPLEVMDLIIQEADRQGLLILLDSHRLNNQRIPELWYGDGFTEEDWINTWVLLATRYRQQRNVIGADLKNEPHGRASWGTGDRTTDWRLAAEKAGNAILAVNPNWLIVVEGVQNNVPGQRLAGHWQGGNLEGVRRYPVRLSNARKLVYSPHEYGQGVFDQPWFSDPRFPQNMAARWETGFQFIATQGTAPILIGEFGGRQVDTQSKEGIWQRRLVNYIKQNQLSFTYWSWNPNSADTGGILTDDWQTVQVAKQQLLSQILPTTTALNSSTSSASRLSPESVSAPASPVPTAAAPSDHTDRISSANFTPISSSADDTSLQTKFTVQSDWETGFCVSFQVVNPRDTSFDNWRLAFEMNQAAISQSWNGVFDQHQSNQRRSTYRVTPADWGKVLQPNQSIDIGFCATKQGTDYLPSNIRTVGL